MSGFRDVTGNSDSTTGFIVWGSKDVTIPLPNIRANGELIRPANPDHDGDDNPRASLAIDGIIKRAYISPHATYNDREAKNGLKSGLRLNIVMSGESGKDYRLVTDLVDTLADQYQRSGLGLLGSIAELARISENPETPEGFLDNYFEISLYRNQAKNGKFYSNSCVRPPVNYEQLEDGSVKPVFDSKEIIRTELAPRGEPQQVGAKTVYDNTAVGEWMHQQIADINRVWGQAETQTEIQTEGVADDQNIAEALEEDQVSTEGLAADLPSPRG